MAKQLDATSKACFTTKSKKKKREESVIELHIIVNANMFFGLMLMIKGVMLVFTLKNLTVRTKSISIINECRVVNGL